MTQNLATVLVECALKGSVLLALAGLLSVALQHRSAAQRHHVWTVAVAGLLLLPPLSLWFPAHTLPVPGKLAPALQALRATSGRPATATPDQEAARQLPFSSETLVAPSSEEAPGIGAVLVRVWAAGVAVILLLLLVSWALLRIAYRGMAPTDDPRIADLARTAARQLGVAENGFRLFESDRARSPMTWGVLRPALILPASSSVWDDDRLRQALIHELAHIRRRDAGTQALCNAACALYWFNPLVWWAARRMIAEREGACDDVVLGSGARPSSYAHELLGVARSLGGSWTGAPVAPAMVRRSQIGVRLLAILDSEQRRSTLSATSKVVATAIGLAVTLLLASVTLARATLIPGSGEPARFSICRTRPMSAVVLPVTNECEYPPQLTLARIRQYLEREGVSPIGAAFARRTDSRGVPTDQSFEVGFFVAPGALKVQPPFESMEFQAGVSAWADVPADRADPWPGLLHWTLDHGYMPRGEGVTVQTGRGRKGLLIACYRWPEQQP